MERNKITVTRTQAIHIVNNLAVFFFAVLLFFLPIAPAIIESSFGFIFLCFLVKTFLEKPSFAKVKHFFSDRINASLLVFYLALACSFFAAGPLWRKSFDAWFFKWGEGVILFYCAQVFLRRQQVKLLLYVLVGSCCLICIDGIYQWVHGRDFIRGFYLTQHPDFFAVRATFNHYNNFATYLIVCFFTAIAGFFHTRKFLVRSFLAAVLVLISANLFLTYSRGGWLALFVGITFFIFFTPQVRAKKIIAYGVIAIFVGFICMPQGSKFLYAFFVRADAGRFRMWHAALSMFQQSPLIGIGLGLFMEQVTEYGLKPVYAHNCYIQILTEAGLFGLVSFLWFIGAVILRALSRLRASSHMVLQGLSCAFIAYLTHAFFDTQLYSLRVSVLFWLLVALLCKYTALENEPPRSSIKNT